MKSNIIRHKWQELSGKIENLLQEHTDPVVIPLQKPFELKVDFSDMETLSTQLPDDHVEKVATVFKRLKSYFDSGILFENNDQKFNAIALFHNGHVRVAEENMHRTQLKLPNSSLHHVLATSSEVFLAKYHLNWDPERKCKAYLVRPTSDFAFVLFSPVPDLWMQSEMPLLVEHLKRIFPI